MNAKKGFTLLEILVTVLIITVLATIVGVAVAKRPGEARVAAARAQIRIFKTALNLYRMEQGFLLTQQQGLRALGQRPEVTLIPPRYPETGYLDSREVPRDPWGNEYVYLVPGRGGTMFEVLSYGGDGQPGGEGENADISSNDI
ncbi:MAG: type II secretion system major pseudopilin GspG [Kiritimatiellae bacterium]|nr:type II secretion system major pseudopilin GspG [Kiritimatiellia bacterium]